jgi:hypothetical protein
MECQLASGAVFIGCEGALNVLCAVILWFGLAGCLRRIIGQRGRPYIFNSYLVGFWKIGMNTMNAESVNSNPIKREIPGFSFGIVGLVKYNVFLTLEPGYAKSK